MVRCLVNNELKIIWNEAKCLEVIRKTTTNIHQNIRCPSRERNRGPPKCRCRGLPLNQTVALRPLSKETALVPCESLRFVSVNPIKIALLHYKLFVPENGTAVSTLTSCMQSETRSEICLQQESAHVPWEALHESGTLQFTGRSNGKSPRACTILPTYIIQ